MGRKAIPFDKTYAPIIYNELLNFVEDNQGFPTFNGFYNSTIRLKYKLSSGAYIHWMGVLQKRGLIEVNESARVYRLQGVNVAVDTDRQTRNEYLAQFGCEDGYAYRDTYRRRLDFVRSQYKLQKGKCWWCSEDLLGVYDIDHIVPLYENGTGDENNLCLSCPQCNHKKGKKLPHEFNGRLF